ncbi:MAG: ornithine--oxo-acid transaminase [Anaerolineales bacterium]|uniref:ornithine aminotransferase n=1 Tax=Candidatus Desulfolinea nitratireducens TaxID=2841698 RepID=A0A8J6TIH9_9CHLR|nr:ornithine--oxo-acid transaminase [Candidatus Desulfolinea nitratireducens]MBL6961519.1 ornithine--oxo-acid transaminase [Anaerolineales bacterium]
MLNTQDFVALEEKFGAHNYHPLDVVIERGEGVWVYDVDGKRYLDCLSAYSAVNQGHVHPKILKALIEQASKVTLTSRAFRNNQLPLLYKELSEITGYEMSLPMNSGAEAVETAIKLARKWAYRVKGVKRHDAEIIVVDGNFHGRTISIVSFSSEEFYKGDFGPFTPGFISVAYGDADAIADAITPNTAAVMIEPIQGEAGVIIPPDGYLQKVAKICRKNNVLFIADEIQTGLGRTGRLFACDYENVRPDMAIIGKALAGGFYPVSAVLADKDLLGLFSPGEHGSTFGGNPLGAAVARAALQVMVNEKLAERADELGTYFMEQLAEIPSPHVKDVRGKGLLIGVELKPEAKGARRFCEALQDRGILVKETHQHVIRFAPPLVIDKETIDGILPPIREVLNMV